MAQSPGGAWFEGLIDIAAKRGLTTLAVMKEDTLYPRASTQGTIALAKKRERVGCEAIPDLHTVQRVP